eukprot:CAMPEP_0183377942 /NCGR_PEP_ID=MMETSP0164_2-20130417/124348_1 /TAXON_ID=221442 /ORGANISM="Coccolithus pelagicus ssp braarudi, Strain PLY182g" /LENGTH=88 /DNA_ID=CAMNT_0025555457 /DNA_START=403 /DNA_END=669 /DNA_ORIENTATION=+
MGRANKLGLLVACRQKCPSSGAREDAPLHSLGSRMAQARAQTPDQQTVSQRKCLALDASECELESFPKLGCLQPSSLRFGQVRNAAFH